VVLTPRRWRQVRGCCVGPTGLRTQRKFANDGGKRARSPGRVRRNPLKPLRAGMPGDSGVLVVTRVRSTNKSAHEAAGAAGTRHSPRPLGAGDSATPRTPRVARSKKCAKLYQRHCERSEAIHSFFARQDGLLRGACHRARIRATRWLAMTTHSPLSSHAKAGDPVFRSVNGGIEKPQRTGYSAFAEYDGRRVSKSAACDGDLNKYHGKPTPAPLQPAGRRADGAGR